MKSIDARIDAIVSKIQGMNDVETEDTSETDYLIYGYDDVAQMHGEERADELRAQLGAWADDGDEPAV